MKAYKRSMIAGVVFLLFLVSLATAVAGTPPAAPAGLTALAGNGEASITWNTVSGATGYILYRGTVSGGPYGFVAETPGTGHSDRGLTNGTRYYYVVTALNADGQSGYSASVNVTPKNTVLPAPIGISATPGNGEVSVVWSPVTLAVSYNVYRATARGGPFTLLSPAAPGPSFTDRGLVNGTPYFYVVQTMSTNAGAYSEEVSATPSALLPAAPAMGTAALAGNGEASITWGTVSGATSYALYRGTATGGPYSFVAETRGTGYTNRGLTNGSFYSYVVTALNANGQSAYSAAVSITPNNTVLTAPTAVSAIPGNGEVSVVWNPVTSAVSYNVFRATARGGPYTLLSPAAPGPSFTDRELANGTPYFYVVQTMSTNAGAYSEEVSAIPSALLPAAPATFTVTPGSTWASLSWSPFEGATAYAIYRGTSIGGPYAFLALSNTQTYEDKTLSNGSSGTPYYYVIAAVNANGRGAYSAEANAPVSDMEQPHAPVLTAHFGDCVVTLHWENAAGAVSYIVHRGTSAGGPYTPLGIQTPGYWDTPLTNGQTYFYVVDALNQSSTVARSNEVAVTPAIKLPAPGNVVVIPGNTQATVTWNPVTGAGSYYVTVATSPGGPAVPGTGTAYGESSTTVTGLTNGTTYYFRVQALGYFSSAQTSAFSTEVSIQPASSLPPAPTGLSVTSGNTQLSVTWSAVTGATGYKIYRRTAGNPWPSTPVGTPTGTLFTDTSLVNGTRYYYIVAAVNAAGPGAWASSEVYGTPDPIAMPAPIHVAVVPGNMQATVTWDPVVGAGGYYVSVARSPGGPEVSGTGNAYGESSTTVTGLTNGTTYYFRVRTLGNYSSAQTSAYSAEVSTIPSSMLPPAPTGLSVTSGNTQLSVTWDAVTGATGYKIYRRTAGTPWPSIPLGTPTATLFTDTDLANGTRYYYIVAAVNAAGPGAWASSEVYGTPDPIAIPAPVHVAVIPGDTQATVTWDPVVTAYGYYVTVATSPGGPATSRSMNAYGQLSVTVTGLTNDQTYYFRVQALGNYSSAQNSAFSAEVSAQPLVSLPAAPTGVNVISGNTQLSITWNAVIGATAYRIYRRTEGEAWPSTPIGTPTDTLFTDTGLVNGVTYYYLVTAVNTDGNPGAWTSSETQGTPDSISLPAPVHVTVIPGNTQATVTWDPVPGASEYQVSVATSPGGPAVSGGNSSGRPSMTMTGLTNDQRYYFRVRAFGPYSSAQQSAYSAEGSAIPLETLPLAPTSVNVLSGNTEISLTWTASTGATGYKIYRRTEGSAWPATPVGTPTAPLFTDTGLANGTTYYYAVAAITAEGTGAWSGDTYGTPTSVPPTAPVNIVATPGNQQATVTWSPVTGATNYYVTVAVLPGGAAIGGSGTTQGGSYILTGLNNEQTYYFRLQAAAGGPWSAYSAEVSAVPNPAANLGNISGKVSVNFAGYGNLGVRNATVSLQGTAYSTIADADGNFLLLNVPFGNYQLVVTATGMDTATQTVSLNIGNLPVTLSSLVVSAPECPTCPVCPTYVPGDATGDGKVGVDDVIYDLQVLSGQR